MPARKVMATVFWDSEGIVLIDYLEHSCTITRAYCADLIGKRRAALEEKRRGQLHRCVLFHQNNAPDHTSSQARSSLQSKMPASNCSIHRIRQTWPPVTSDCFKNWRNSWKDWNLLTMLSILKWLPWLEDLDREFFYNEILALEKRWTNCISVVGDYVEERR